MEMRQTHTVRAEGLGMHLHTTASVLEVRAPKAGVWTQHSTDDSLSLSAQIRVFLSLSLSLSLSLVFLFSLSLWFYCYLSLGGVLGFSLARSGG